MPELKFTSKAKKSKKNPTYTPSAAQCAEVHAEAVELMGGSFAIDRMFRQGKVFTLSLVPGPRGGTSVDEFTKRVRS